MLKGFVVICCAWWMSEAVHKCCVANSVVVLYLIYVHGDLVPDVIVL